MADIIVVLTALYQRANNIITTLLQRVAFQYAFPQIGTSGFRPGCIKDIPCKQYTISVVRDPNDPAWVKPIVIYRIS